MLLLILFDMNASRSNRLHYGMFQGGSVLYEIARGFVALYLLHIDIYLLFFYKGNTVINKIDSI